LSLGELRRGEATVAGDQHEGVAGAVRCDDQRLEQPLGGDRGGELVDVADVSARVVLVRLDLGRLQFLQRRGHADLRTWVED
jgi:hypothetical protein